MELVAAPIRFSPRKVPVPVMAEHLNSPPSLCIFFYHIKSEKHRKYLKQRTKVRKRKPKKKSFQKVLIKNVPKVPDKRKKPKSTLAQKQQPQLIKLNKKELKSVLKMVKKLRKFYLRKLDKRSQKLKI